MCQARGPVHQVQVLTSTSTGIDMQELGEVHKVQVLTNRRWVWFSLHYLHIITFFTCLSIF